MPLPSFASLRPAGLTAAASAGVGSQRPPHISIDANRFSLVDSTGNVKQLPPVVNGQTAIVALDVVFIDANPKPSKIYWGTDPYQPGSNAPPLCFSDNGIAPSTQAQAPQNTVCVSCPHNAIGSAISKFSGAKIRACQDFKKLAAVIPADADGMVYLMQVKPGSFKNWSSYIGWLRGQKTPAGTTPDLCDVVTRMTFESQGVLKFEPVALVQEGTPVADQVVAGWMKREMLDEMVGKNDQPIQGLLGGPQASPLGSPQVPAPPAAYQSIGMAPPPIPTAQPAPAASPSSFQMPQAQPPAETKKRGRPKKEEAQPETLDIPPFLQRAPQPAPAPQPHTQQFGLAQPQTPGPDLQARLAEAFKLPT